MSRATDIMKAEAANFYARASILEEQAQRERNKVSGLMVMVRDAEARSIKYTTEAAQERNEGDKLSKAAEMVK